MYRSRNYHRRMRAKHIKRKKNIASHYCGFTEGYYPHDGMYSKNKIHCSCCLCKTKAYFGKHVTTLEEKRALQRMKEELVEINQTN